VISSLNILSLVVFLSRFQYGFRRFNRTATASTNIMDSTHLSVERSGFLVAFLLNFSKAFDSMVCCYRS
jgi:hypothetical protein